MAKADQVQQDVDAYLALHNDQGSSSEDRKASYATLVNHYYDLATDFYEFGWGQSFHFAPMAKGRSFKQAIVEHEHYMADRLALEPGSRVLDVGCGVGGPMREIARYTGATIIGINNNAYQIERGQKYVKKAGLEKQCSFIKADFMALPIEDESCDAVYAIESTCHASERTELYREMYRVLKPGGRFTSYEWCLTGSYDAASARHRQLKKDIEVGNGLPDLVTQQDTLQAFRAAGFEVMEEKDLAADRSSGVPWYAPLKADNLSLRSLARGPVGRGLVNVATRVMEKVRLAPKGTTEVSSFLNAGADALVAAGEADLFTPMYFVLARRPG